MGKHWQERVTKADMADDVAEFCHRFSKEAPKDLSRLSRLDLYILSNACREAELRIKILEAS